MHTLTSNRSRRQGPFRISYRYIPGTLGTGSSLDNGAVMVEEFRLRKSAIRFGHILRSDPRVQWVDDASVANLSK